MPHHTPTWSHWFTAATFQRGLDYFKRQKVHFVKIFDSEHTIRGSVSGSGGSSYSQRLVITERGHHFQCDCPVGTSCKHTVAVLLQAEVVFGVSRVNQVLMLEPFLEEEDEVLFSDDRDCRHWLEDVVSEVRNASHKNETKTAIATAHPTNTIAYSIEVDTGYAVHVQLYLTRWLKKGGLGAMKRAGNLTGPILYNHSFPASYSEEDVRILRTAYIEDCLDIYGAYFILKGEVGFALLQRMLATGRCVLEGNNNHPVIDGGPVEGMIAWEPMEDGTQAPMLFSRRAHEFMLMIKTDPPSYILLGEKQTQCGELTGLPDVNITHKLLQAPPHTAEQVDATVAKLAELFPTDSDHAGNIGMPQKFETLDITPTPHLFLDGISFGPRNVTMAIGQLSYDYQGAIIPFGAAQQFVTVKHGDKKQQVLRDREAERLALTQLPDDFEPIRFAFPDLPEEYPDFDGNDLILGIPDAFYQRRWLHFLSNTAPRLTELGWQITVSENFPFQFDAVDDDDWYAQIEEGDDDFESSGTDWFELKLGVTVNGEAVNILPAVAKQLTLLPSVEQLKQMPTDELVPLKLENNRFITLPAPRLAAIMGTLLELFGERPQSSYRIEPYHAALWQQLSDGLGLPWAGADKLTQLANELKTFDHLHMVEPAATLNAALRDYQKYGLSWMQFLRQYGLNGILADDMGLGKTLQTLAHLQLEKVRLKEALPPSLVVCPTSLLHNWANEVAKFTPDLRVHIHHGSDRDLDAIAHADVVLTSYGVVQRDFETLKETPFHLLVLDEAQAVKNHKAKSALAVRTLKAQHKLCITGTPMENHLGELWALFDFLMPGFLSSREHFNRFYRNPIEKDGNAERGLHLKRRIAPFMLRRSKELVAAELPAKTEIIRSVQLKSDQRDLYETIRASMESKVRTEISKKGLARSQIVILDALLKLRQACCDPSLVKLEQSQQVKGSAKLDSLLEMVEPLVEEGRKILIFSQFTTMLGLIEQRLKAANISWVKLTGQTRNRQQPIEQFQNGDAAVFLISLKAGGTGLNLTAADTVIHYDPWWNPAVEDQATDRAYRIGQDKPVFVYKLVTEGTVEEKIQQLKTRKKALADQIYKGGSDSDGKGITADDLNVLFEPL